MKKCWVLTANCYSYLSTTKKNIRLPAILKHLQNKDR